MPPINRGEERRGVKKQIEERDQIMDPLLERKLSQAVPLTVVTSTAVAVAGSFVFGISVCIDPLSTLDSF